MRLERGEIPLPRVGKSKDAATMPDEEVLDRCREIARVFHYVEDLLKQEGLGTFGHIITRAVDLLSRRQSVLQRAQKYARFILIDEFQDSNVAQIQLAKLLGGEEANVFAVGDPDQAIYRFRGATSGAFDQFLKTFDPGRVKRVTLSKNRRSTPPILRCAYQTIQLQPAPSPARSCTTAAGRASRWAARVWKTTRRWRRHRRCRPSCTTATEQEAKFVADTIEAMRQQRPAMKLHDIAVLYRTHANRDEVLAELRRRDIPVHVQGVDLFDTPEARDAMAALQIMESSNPIALVRVAAFPQFSVDPEEFRAALALAGKKASDRVGAGEGTRRLRGDGIGARGATRSGQRQRPAGPAMKIAQQVFQLADSLPLRRLAGTGRAMVQQTQAAGGAGNAARISGVRRVVSRGGWMPGRGWRGRRSGGGAGAYRLQQSGRSKTLCS